MLWLVFSRLAVTLWRHVKIKFHGDEYLSSSHTLKRLECYEQNGITLKSQALCNDLRKQSDFFWVTCLVLFAGVNSLFANHKYSVQHVYYQCRNLLLPPRWRQCLAGNAAPPPPRDAAFLMIIRDEHNFMIFFFSCELEGVRTSVWEGGEDW